MWTEKHYLTMRYIIKTVYIPVGARYISFQLELTVNTLFLNAFHDSIFLVYLSFLQYNNPVSK